jgi:peptidoglycan/LPS O-acetylase OafA/YrhL
MSGCLIVASYENRSSLIHYIEKRARRILPAYWAALAFTLVIGVIFTSLPRAGFLRSVDTWKYVLSNITFLNFIHPTLPGLFTNNPVMDSVNGSLWTIKIEVMFYFFAPLLVYLCGRWGAWQTLAGVFLFSLIYKSICERLHHDSLALQLPAQLGFFSIGALVYYYYSWFAMHARVFWGVALASYVTFLFSDWTFFRVIGISLLVMCVGLLFPIRKGQIKAGDFSYGVYVFHFPVIQTFLAVGIFHNHPLFSVGSIAVIVACLAFASWHLIEKPYLLRSRAKKQVEHSVMTRA